ncbi:MAG: NAD-dependent epimerase/dehydratase family protein [Eubacteriales bacterium]|nr:NAD-dependent epimerase/dehydratase family protein [Eubacteriales bacterium]MDD4323695.1 NAD-dependent epimerase/dehydratase family protein [Eubacteriales bacterium]MDD4542131.1 NAD-dependent epimerase/dehydratase family protein [Eubacteriales bacterium]
MKNKKTIYIVSGASGHLGNTVVRKLLQKGETVRCLIMEAERPKALQGLECEVYSGDITKAWTLPAVFSGLGNKDIIVLHLASMISIGSKEDPRLTRTNVAGTGNMLDLARRYKVKRFLYCSSVHAIPEKKYNAPISEVDQFHADWVQGAYAKSKATATEKVLQAGREGLDVVVVHPSGIIGPNDFLDGRLVQVLLDFADRRLNTLVRGGYDMVDVRDVADGLIAAAEKGRSGETYILSNEIHSIRELCDIAAAYCGREPIRSLAPFKLVKLLAPLFELWGKLRKKRPLFTSYALYSLESNSNFSNKKARRELGFSTRPFEETVADTMAFLERNKRFHYQLKSLKAKARS